MIIDGKNLAEKIRDEVKVKIAKLSFQPGLAVIRIGDNWESKLYIEQKQKACNEVGVRFVLYQLPESVAQNTVITLIEKLNIDSGVHGIIVQLPINQSLNLLAIQQTITPWKDVDGFNPINRGMLFNIDRVFPLEVMLPCTPQACIKLLQSIDYDLKGKKVVIVGRSNIVGKPLFHLCLQQNATVTLCHSNTRDLEKETTTADVLIVAVGHPQLIQAKHVKNGAVVIDVGINRVFTEENKSYRIAGDVDFENIKDQCSYITPVPGGVGPMTVAMLMQNILQAANLSQNINI